MEIISNCTQGVIEKAAKALKDGHLVAFPTETVYGLGADATNEKAVSRIYSVKGRPTSHPLIVHIASINQLDKWARDIPEYAIKLAREFWPGPMTLILKRSELARDFITGGQDHVGLRVPNNSVALEIMRAFENIEGFGIAAPSANRFGAVSPTTAQAVEDELYEFLGEGDLILDDGSCELGIESTIVDCTKADPIILRPGAITNYMIEEITNLCVSIKLSPSEIRFPGMMVSHYSPSAKIVLGLADEPGNGFIALADIPTPSGAIRLASPKNIEEFARVLYKAFRLGDQERLSKIFVVAPEGSGLALAIRDRLAKAASGKSIND